MFESSLRGAVTCMHAVRGDSLANRAYRLFYSVVPDLFIRTRQYRAGIQRIAVVLSRRVCC